MNKSWDPIWEDIFKDQEWGKYPSESLIQFIARNFYKLDRSKIKLLEIGCGPGANIWYMSRENFDVYGIDGSKKAVEIANNRLLNERLRASVISGDIINLPYNNNFFDGIIDVECLCCNNYENTQTILQNIHKVLKNGSLFYSRTFSNEMFIGSGYKVKNKNEYKDIQEGPLKNKGFVRLTARDDIKNLYGQFFEITSIDKIDYTSNNGSILISEWVVICRKG